METAKCKECMIKCPYRDELLKLNPESTCVTPNQRYMALQKGTSVRMLSEETLEHMNSDLLAFILDKIQNEDQERTQANWAFRLLEMINDTKRSWFPATQKNINANINLFDEQLKRFNENYRKLREEKDKKKEMVITINEDEIKEEENEEYGC